MLFRSNAFIYYLNKWCIQTCQSNIQRIIYKSIAFHYYPTTSTVRIWKKESILLLCLSLLFFFFLFQCYSQHSKTYIKIFQLNLIDLKMLLMFMTLIFQYFVLHSITIFFYTLYVIQFEKAINIQEEDSKIVAITSIMVKKCRGLITFTHLKSLTKFIFYTLYILLLYLFSFLYVYNSSSSAKIDLDKRM